MQVDDILIKTLKMSLLVILVLASMSAVLGSNSLAGSDIKMVKWDGSQWAQLETAEKTKDDTYTYYETGTATAAYQLQCPRRTPVPTPGFEFVLVVAALCSVYLFGRKRR